VRYSSCHSNIKFISSRHRVISSIAYILPFTVLVVGAGVVSVNQEEKK